MNFWIVLHWLAYVAVVAFAVSVLVLACRGAGAWYREWQKERELKRWTDKWRAQR